MCNVPAKPEHIILKRGLDQYVDILYIYDIYIIIISSQSLEPSWNT